MAVDVDCKAFQWQKSNLVRVAAFNGQAQDVELLKLLAALRSIASEKVKDVRQVLPLV